MPRIDNLPVINRNAAALIAAASDKKKIVDDAAVRKAINDLEQD